MNKIPVRVRIHTRHQLEDGSVQTFTSRTKGFLYQKEETLYITYQETNGEDQTRIRTTWKIESQQAILIRQGASSLRALFRVGISDRTALVTPHGSLFVEVQAYRLNNQITRDGGILRVGYQMDIAGSVSRMDVELHIKL